MSSVTTMVAAAAFLDAFQKVADMATNTRGATREIGSALTRMCMRHRSIETKLRQFSAALIDCLINPLQDQMEEWKKVANQLDKDHAKEYKKARQEIKKKSSDTLKLQKKARKGKGDIQPQLDSALQDVNDKYLLLEETEKQAVRRALIEERSRFCSFVSMLRPVVEEEMSMLGEVTHLQTIADDLTNLTVDPHKLPSASEQVIIDLKGSDYNWTYQTPPSSPSTTMSRKSSVCSSNQPQQVPVRLSSVSSHDSGFISQDAFQSKSPSPMPPEGTNQNSSSSASSEASETCQSVSECSSPTSVSSGSTMGAWASTEKVIILLALSVSLPVKLQNLDHRIYVEELEARDELALALSRGLQLDTQRSSRDSLQCSSGYSTQTTTPCCSEDTIPSQVSDYDYFSVSGDQDIEQPEFDKSSTIPRNSDLSQSYRRMFQAKRPASTAGLPTNTGPVMVTPGVATIRRTPSTKPSVRRGTVGGGPIPIKTPMIPVKTPTVPDVGSLSGAQSGPDESPDQVSEAAENQPVSPKRGGMPLPSWNSATQVIVIPPVPSQTISPTEEERSSVMSQQITENGGSIVGTTVAATDGDQSCTGTALSLQKPEAAVELPALDAAETPQGEDMLSAIRRGVKLRKTITNDRSAPRFS
uniref:MTSS I-BAR domain containing 1 n=1 Tax=Callorhinchus milii TaxID=7868 RepID=A0A4W3JQS4_CALMI